jgi:hypothetical protein
MQRIARTIVATGLALGALAPAAHAAFGIQAWNAEVRKSATPGDLETRAGSHPFVGVTDFTLNNNAGMADGNVRNVRVDLPPGLMSNPEATSKKCTDSEFPNCPPESKLGHVDAYVGLPAAITADVFNMVPGPGQVSDFAFDSAFGRTDIVGGVRSTDYGLFFTISDIPQNANLNRSVLTFCGFASPDNGCPQLAKPFITLPTACIGPQTTMLTVQSYAGETASAKSTTPVGASDCDKLPYAPEMLVTATAQTSPKTGVGLEVTLKQAAGEANTKKVSVQLPPLFSARLDTINQSCTEDVFKKDPKTCPEGSKVGTARAVTPLLHDRLNGTAFLVAHTGGALPTLEVVLSGPGVTVNLSGSIALGGGIRSTFDGVPDVPLTEFVLSLPAGPNSALASTADLCGTALTLSATLESHSGKTVEAKPPIPISGCPIKIVSAKARGTSAALTVRVPSAGTLVLTGRGLKGVKRKVSAATTSKLKMKLTKKGRAALLARRARRKKLNVKVTARFVPAAGANASRSNATAKLTFK